MMVFLLLVGINMDVNNCFMNTKIVRYIAEHG